MRPAFALACMLIALASGQQGGNSGDEMFKLASEAADHVHKGLATLSSCIFEVEAVAPQHIANSGRRLMQKTIGLNGEMSPAEAMKYFSQHVSEYSPSSKAKRDHKTDNAHEALAGSLVAKRLLDASSGQVKAVAKMAGSKADAAKKARSKLQKSGRMKQKNNHVRQKHNHVVNNRIIDELIDIRNKVQSFANFVDEGLEKTVAVRKDLYSSARELGEGAQTSSAVRALSGLSAISKLYGTAAAEAEKAYKEGQQLLSSKFSGFHTNSDLSTSAREVLDPSALLARGMSEVVAAVGASIQTQQEAYQAHASLKQMMQSRK